ncbi:MAG: RES family NAD+ phosphorylase [Acidobacteria bacterium]|nr:RES family NAD+ phosphorylase [Acidobacteriota bacterium]
MEVFRLAREKYARRLTGIGASLKGARWNSPGVELIYTAENRSLAMAEVAVHLTVATVPSDYRMITIHIPDDLDMEKVSLKQLKDGWNRFPHKLSTQVIGDGFVAANKCCLIRVPSAVTKGDYNILINPRHPDFRRISIVRTERFPLDTRLFR